MLAGFNDAQQRRRDEQLSLAITRSQTEGKVFETLLNSPDEHVRAMAGAGLLSSATGPQRKGGIRGWIGEMESNPYVDQIKQYQASLQPTPTQQPSPSVTGVAPGAPGTAGQVSTQTTRAGQPGPEPSHADTAIPFRTPIPAGVGQPPPTAGEPAPTPGPIAAPVGQPPPHVFPTSEDLAAQHYRGEYSGEVQGIVQGVIAAGGTREEGLAAAQRHIMGRIGMGGSGFGALHSSPGYDSHGNLVQGFLDNQPGSPTYRQWLDDRGNPIEGFVQASTTSTMPRGDRQAITLQVARERGKSPAQLTADDLAEVTRRVVALGGEKAGTSATGRQTALAKAPLSREQHLQGIREATEAWNRNSAPIRTMQQQLAHLQAGLQRLQADPNGGAQAILTSFDAILKAGTSQSDYARTAEGQPLMDRIQALLTRYGTGGQGVQPEHLQEIAQTAQGIVDSMGPWAQQFRSQIENQLQAPEYSDQERSGVFGEIAPAAPAAPGGVSPRVGTSPTGQSAPPQTVKNPDGTWSIIIK